MIILADKYRWIQTEFLAANVSIDTFKLNVITFLKYLLILKNG